MIQQEMRVSQTSVREALSALQLGGIVERIPGSGSHVHSAIGGLGVLTLLEKKESVDDSLEARWLIERSVIELARERMTPEKLGQLEKILEEMHPPLAEKNYKDYIKINERFHLALAQATESQLIVKVMKLLLKVTHQELWKRVIIEYFLNDERHLWDSFEKHQRIIEAIKRNDKEQARRVMEDHFLRVRRILEDNFSH